MLSIIRIFPGLTYTVFQLAGDVIVAGQADKAGYRSLATRVALLLV